MTERRGRWSPTKQQISLAIDLAVARMPLERAAVLKMTGLRGSARRTRLRTQRPEIECFHPGISHRPKPPDDCQELHA
jgi:hypothetical protein